MINSKHLFLFLATVFALSACIPAVQPKDDNTGGNGGNENPGGPDTPGGGDTALIEIQESAPYIFTSTGGQLTLHTNLSKGSLSCESPGTWCHVSVVQSVTPYQVAVEADPYWESQEAPREISLAFTKDGKSAGSFRIIQDPVARLKAPALLPIPASGGRFRFRVATNVYQVDAEPGFSPYEADQYDNSILSDVSAEADAVSFTLAAWDVTTDKPLPACIRVSAHEQVATFVRIEYLDPHASSENLPYEPVSDWD